MGFTATAYGPPWNAMEGGSQTSTGVDLGRGQLPIIAVDPSVIPYGSIVKVSNSPFGKNKLFVAGDTGGAITGNHIDFFVNSGRQAQNDWGKQNVDVSIVRKGNGASSVNDALKSLGNSIKDGGGGGGLTIPTVGGSSSGLTVPAVPTTNVFDVLGSLDKGRQALGPNPQATTSGLVNSGWDLLSMIKPVK